MCDSWITRTRKIVPVSTKIIFAGFSKTPILGNTHKYLRIYLKSELTTLILMVHLPGPASAHTQHLNKRSHIEVRSSAWRVQCEAPVWCLYILAESCRFHDSVKTTLRAYPGSFEPMTCPKWIDVVSATLSAWQSRLVKNTRNTRSPVSAAEYHSDVSNSAATGRLRVDARSSGSCWQYDPWHRAHGGNDIWESNEEEWIYTS